jgi:glycerol-3-phosphate dehydrogenase (NAD(P)+)
MRVAVLGGGAWGTALAIAFSSRHQVTLWARNPDHVAALARDRVNTRYLAGVRLPDSLVLESSLEQAVKTADLLLIVTSTNGLGETVDACTKVRKDLPVLWACKGFESSSGRLAHEIVSACLPDGTPRGILSGPSFALEVAQGKPAALTLASKDEEFAAATAAALNGPALRIYSNNDVLGVELGGALKNVMAIAAGISDGMGLGDNARAALVTRGLAEITRLGVRLGGKPETFMGLTGLGDLILTTAGGLSRNRTVGLHLAKGQTLPEILQNLGHVAEGVHSAPVARDLAKRHQVDMPITNAVCAVLFEGLPAREAVQQLLARDPRAE